MAKDLRFPRINQIVVSGRLTKDADLRYTQNGTPVATLPIAIDHNYKKDDEWVSDPSFIDVVVWSQRAEQCAEYLHKGSAVIVEGRLHTRLYENNEGKKSKFTSIVANRVQFLEWNEPRGEAKAEGESFEDEEKPPITDDDVPF